MLTDELGKDLAKHSFCYFFL